VTCACDVLYRGRNLVHPVGEGEANYDS
jgi:hypothetical protein